MPKPNEEARASALEGTILGPYTVGAKLGSGGAAAVYVGARTGSAGKQLVALKVIHEHLAEEAEFVNMFLDEGRVATLLLHPNIVRTFELGQDKNTLYIAMEYLDGQSLHDVFVRGTKHGARLPVDLVAWIGACVARALHHAHNLTDADGSRLDLIHRDVSPRNIFLTYDGDVKLIDFGIAHAAGRIAKTAVGQMKGTFSYIAPERALGGSCDHRADQFSLAAALFEASTGKRLFRGVDEVSTLRNVLSGSVPDPRELRDGFPEELCRILKTALAKSPSARYPDCAALAGALDAFRIACGREDPRSRLAALMQSVFGEERARRQDAINRFDVGSPLPDSNHDVSHVAVSSTSSHTALARPRRNALLIVSAAAACFALATAFVAMHRASPPQPLAPASAALAAIAPPAAARVTIDLALAPAVLASFDIDGTTYAGSEVHLVRDRSDAPFDVRVRAEGYESTSVRVTPSRDQRMTIPLATAPAPISSSVAPASSRRPPRATAPRQPRPLGELLNRRY